ncbi:MAG TPA: leucyl/phenylalanyl-tRNA--protein transferase [Vicinamibacterales bacterium]|nr:leucyl/phenylalanyl-tRNA--protein transferase [Vicinamibacterales bacterium]
MKGRTRLVIPWLGPDDPFPPVHTALRDPNGLLAVGRSLSVPSLIDAYSHGIFPWFNRDEPIMWWSPDPRMVLFPRELHVSRSLARRMRRGGYAVRMDTAFEAVMRGCAAPRAHGEGTWIDDRMLGAYTQLHAAGYAHSVETWIDDELAGGLYGVAIGRAFFGESMFTRRTDASKIALVTLVRLLDSWGFGVIDCQMRTEHLASFGAREIPRSEFLEMLRDLVRQPSAWGTVPGPSPV